MAQKAIILLSGGMDSATTLALAQEQGYDLYALSFDYRQRHNAELTAARTLAGHYHCQEHLVIQLDAPMLKASALVDRQQAIPKNQYQPGTIPVTYVPARNTLFLSYALSWAETLNAFDIFIGISQVDYSGYPDCRPEYIQAFTKLCQLATQAGVEQRGTFTVHTPLLYWSKADTVCAGQRLGVPYQLTLSCYDPFFMFACGACDACSLRRRGFAEAGIADPTYYVP